MASAGGDGWERQTRGVELVGVLLIRDVFLRLTASIESGVVEL
jgi:hypothetical protein